MLSGGEVGGVVEEDEGLEGCVGARAADDAGFAVGGVEGGHSGWRAGAFPEGVEAAASGIGSGVGGIFFAAFDGDIFPEAIGLPWFDARAADLLCQKAARVECAVADEFGGESESGGVGEESVAGIEFAELWGDVRGLAVGLGEEDGFEEGAVVPVGFNEFDGEPIEEFGVRGWGALDAEVFGGFDDAGAEEQFPGAVRSDSGGQRVFGVCEPVGEVESSGLRRVGAGAGVGVGVGAGVGIRIRGIVKHCRDSGGDLWAELVVLSADEDVCGSSFGEFLHDHGEWDVFVDFGAFGWDGGEFGAEL